MPSGRVHAKCSFYLSPIVSVTVGIVAAMLLGSVVSGFVAGFLSGFGCLLGILLTPDLDQESINTVEYKIIRWTMGLGFVWTMIWFPYAVMTDHRGIASHFPIISTIGRLAYITAWVAIFTYIFGWQYHQPNWMYVAWVVVGLLVSDIAHWALDVKYGDPFDHKKRYHAKRAK